MYEDTEPAVYNTQLTCSYTETLHVHAFHKPRYMGGRFSGSLLFTSVQSYHMDILLTPLIGHVYIRLGLPSGS